MAEWGYSLALENMMIEKIADQIRRSNTWGLTLLIALITVGLTNGLNFLFSRLAGVALNLRLVFYGSLDALLITLVVGFFLIHTFQRNASLNNLNHNLVKEIDEQKNFGQAAERRASNLAIINELSLESSLLSSDTNFIERIAEKLLSITEAMAVAISLYDPASCELVTEYIAIPEGLLKEISQRFGFELIGMRSPVNDAMLKQMTSEVATTTYNLTQLTAGVVQPAVSTTVQAAFGVNSFTALAFLNKGQLWGAAVIANRVNQEPIDSEVAKIISQVVAVTLQRFEAERSLQQREASLRLITDNMADIINQVDSAFRLVYASPSAKRMTGFDVTDILGRRVLDFIHPDDISMVDEEFESATKVPKISSRLEVRIRRADGSTFWTESEIRYLYDEQGAFTGAVIGSRNIEERKAVELDRRKLMMDLAAKNKELEQFTYSVSHDLRSPLITIKGFIGYVVKDLADHRYERIERDALRIDETATKMQRLLDELLELSRIGRMMNPPQQVAFREMIDEALKLLSGRVTSGGVQVDVATELPVVFGDRTRLVQVLQNLIENALKFVSDQPEPHIQIGTRGIGEDGKVILFVKDNGIGIDPDNLERIFNMFSKLDPSKEGSGIGLAMVKRIVELHGGRLWVESKGLGKGACFCFTLEGSS
jgi:PAS domain S-box-containing protein